MRCPRCGYEWKPRVPSPKECPRCKARLDFQTSPLPRALIKKEKEVMKGMPTTKRLLAPLVIIVVAAGLGVWLWPSPAVHGWTPISSAKLILTRSPDGSTLTITAVGLQTGPYGSFGIENIYIIKQGFTAGTENGARDDMGNVYEVISSDGQTVNIPYEENFGFCVEFRVRGDNVAYFTLDNVYIYFTTTGGAWSETDNELANERTADWIAGTAASDWAEYRLTGSAADGVDDNATTGAVGKYYPYDVMRVQMIKDNDGNWYKLAAGASIQFRVEVYSWK